MASPLDLLSACIGFDWDEANSRKIWIRHQVSPGECEEAFFNNPLLVAADEKHSQKEPRYFALGQTDAGRGLFLVFTIRRALVRAISARDMSRRERKEYERAKEERGPDVPK
ncbi:MAG TPA: BrnT family toxin [Anaerolineales bacterium]|nr:BrnT family toxin [Anaerolineales bacterium]